MSAGAYDPPVAEAFTLNAGVAVGIATVGAVAVALRAFHALGDVEGWFTSDLVGDEVEVRHHQTPLACNNRHKPDHIHLV